MKTAFAANSLLIEFYWDLGQMIVEKQSKTAWGEKLIDQLSADLKKEFPNLKGLSRSNLFYVQQIYRFYSDTIVQQPVGQFMQQPVAQLT